MNLQTRGLQVVSYHQVYDLVFRARNARLSAAAYTVDFMEWVRAGIAFNTRGLDSYSRRISYFCDLYKVIARAHTLPYEQGLEFLRTKKFYLEEALYMYYEDLCWVYFDHLSAKVRVAAMSDKVKTADFEDLFVLPCFDSVPLFKDLFETRQVRWDSYTTSNTAKLDMRLDTVQLSRDSALYRCMSLVFDYGFQRKESGVLLEVILWET